MDPDSDPAIFIIDLQDANKKLIYKKIFCILLFEGTFSSIFKNKKVKKKSRNSRNQGFFLPFLLNDRRIRIKIQEAQKQVDPDPDPDSDPDPQHCI